MKVTHTRTILSTTCAALILAVTAQPAHAGILDSLFGSGGMRVDMHMEFINGVIYSGHDYCEEPVTLGKPCFITFTLDADNIIPKSQNQIPNHKTMVFRLARALEGQNVPENTIGIIYYRKQDGNAHYSLHSTDTVSTDEELADGKAVLNLLYDSKSASGIVGLRPNRMKIGTVTFKTSPDDR